MQLFTAELPEQLCIDVELQNTTYLQVAMSLARAYECRGQAAPVAPGAGSTRLSTRSTGWQRPSTPLPFGPRQSAPDTATTVSSTAIAPPGRPIRQLNPFEMAERCKKGLCFNCDEQFIRGHRCQRLFYIDVSDDDDDDGPDDTPAEPNQAPTVSLHALTGIRSIRANETMQLNVMVGKKEFIALLDTGSTQFHQRRDGDQHRSST